MPTAPARFCNRRVVVLRRRRAFGFAAARASPPSSASRWSRRRSRRRTRRGWKPGSRKHGPRGRRDRNDADALIWLGRRTAYLGRYREAIQIFSDGIARHPTDARMLRHRGHRYLTVRELDRAIVDFEKAVELMAGQPDAIEPDGLPNARNIATGTLHSNVWYHLALGYYLQGDFSRAAETGPGHATRWATPTISSPPATGSISRCVGLAGRTTRLRSCDRSRRTSTSSRTPSTTSSCGCSRARGRRKNCSRGPAKIPAARQRDTA